MVGFKRPLLGGRAAIGIATLVLFCSGAYHAYGSVVPTKSPLANFLSMLNLARPDMLPVARQWQRHGPLTAINAYKQILITHLSRQRSPGLPDLWLWGLTDPRELLRHGVVKTQDYGGGPGDVTSYTIGFPPNVRWAAEPANGYLTAVRDISTMQWDGTLARAFIKTGDPDYARRWLAYWADFSKNWLNSAKKEQHNPKILGYLGTSIQWPTGSILYFGWRIKNFIGYLQSMAKAHPRILVRALSSRDLAAVLDFEANYDLARGVRGLRASGGVPNQRMELATAVLWAGTALVGMKESPNWRSVALSAIGKFLRYQTLPDGTSVEQSFNYNKGLPHKISEVEQMVMNLRPKEQRNVWLARLSRTARYRWYFLNSLIMPDGKIPQWSPRNATLKKIVVLPHPGAEVEVVWPSSDSTVHDQPCLAWLRDRTGTNPDRQWATWNVD